jgi:hypothetical protein
MLINILKNKSEIHLKGLFAVVMAIHKYGNGGLRMSIKTLNSKLNPRDDPQSFLMGCGLPIWFVFYSL